MTVDPNGIAAMRDAIVGNPFNDDQLARMAEALLASHSSAIVEEPMPVAWRYRTKTTERNEWGAWCSADSDPRDWLWLDNWTDMQVEETIAPQPHTGRAAIPERPPVGAGLAWTDLAYRDPENLAKKDGLRFTRYNMEVAYLAGWQAARASFNAALTVEPEAPWQDIKTAPRDGTAFLATSEINGTTQVIGYDPGDVDTEPHWSDVGCKIATPTTWFNLHYFTHWMPLPPARIRSALAP